MSVHPPITGAVVRIEGRDLFVPVNKIAGFETGKVQFHRLAGRPPAIRAPARGAAAGPRPAGPPPDQHGRGSGWSEPTRSSWPRSTGSGEVVGVDPTSRPVLRRLFPGRSDRGIRPGTLLDWESIEPFVSHVPSARLRIPYRKLARLHPAQIADMVEAASHEEGEEIIEAVKADRELEADVFEELDTEHQVEFVRSRSDAEAARLLAAWPPTTPPTSSWRWTRSGGSRSSTLLPAAPTAQGALPAQLQPRDGRWAHEPGLPRARRIDPTVPRRSRRSGTSTAPPESLNVVFTLDDEGSVAGSVSAVVADQGRPVGHPRAWRRARIPAHVHPDWDLHAVVRKMSDFNLTVAPVMDEEHSKMLGVVTVDDVLEMLLPERLAPRLGHDCEERSDRWAGRDLRYRRPGTRCGRPADGRDRAREHRLSSGPHQRVPKPKSSHARSPSRDLTAATSLELSRFGVRVTRTPHDRQRREVSHGRGRPPTSRTDARHEPSDEIEQIERGRGSLGGPRRGPRRRHPGRLRDDPPARHRRAADPGGPAS